MVVASKDIQQYFARLEKGCMKLYETASEARKKGYDPDTVVEVSLAKNMAERVIGLISVLAPQMKETNAAERIIELEKQYGLLDWRVAFVIAEEVARQKFCAFASEKEAMEVGVRTGFAYITVGVVSSPLEGFTSIDLKDRRDGGGKYFCLNFAGPVRNAGGTAASVCVLIADYIRVKFGYAAYDPTPEEIKRCYTELEDYHEYVTNLQYFGSQPWPFPHSLMIAFVADYAGGEITPAPDEIEDAQWFDIDALPKLPNRISIARRLIDGVVAEMRAG